jgi:hypothetical protein
MPTYRNDGIVTVPIRDTKGRQKLVAPGGSIETYDRVSSTDLVRTSDDPVYSPVIKTTDVEFTEGEGLKQTIILQPDTVAFQIYDFSTGLDNIYVRLEDYGVDPLLWGVNVNSGGSGGFISVPKALSRIALISLSETVGTCKVSELRDNPYVNAKD